MRVLSRIAFLTLGGAGSFLLWRNREWLYQKGQMVFQQRGASNQVRTFSQSPANASPATDGENRSATMPGSTLFNRPTTPMAEMPEGAAPPAPPPAASGNRMREMAHGLAPQFDDPVTGQLDAYGDDETITDRVLTNLGRYLQTESLPHLNVNTQANGVVYLRGPVRSETQRREIEQLVRATEGVREVVNEIEVQQELGEVR